MNNLAEVRRTIIAAKPQANGNHRSDFIAAYSKLRRVLTDIDDAKSALATDVTHGRNYQHLPDGVTVAAKEAERVSQQLFEARMIVGRLLDDLERVLA